jgi:enediyne biosynthesis protein E7
MIELFARLGDVYRVYVPTRQSYTYVIHHPDDVKRVLVSNHRNYTKGTGIDRIKLLLGKGIMTSEGERWKRQRSMMQPFFHRRVITRFGRVIAEVNDRYIARWERLAGRGEPINVTEETSELTLEIVLRSILGSDHERLAQQLGANPFEVVAKDAARNLQFVYKFRSLTKLLLELITRRRAEPQEHFDYLDMLMGARDKESGAPMSDGELIDEVMTLIVAGHETTASGLNWSWDLLSQHPEAEARLWAELDASTELSAPSLAQVEALPYTQQVVNEALRLYPPGWALSRRTIEADVLGGFAVPPRTNVVVPLYLVHRHPRFWKDPDTFWPERFAPEHEAERPRFAYMPFAAGPRHCIGETLALYEMLVHLYKVARRYRLRYVADKPIELEAQVNLRTRHPLHMRLERR